ncbi:MAG: response regulator [Bacteroidia bacterium]|nr:response regulator [Bacteroidia bacterium]
MVNQFAFVLIDDSDLDIFINEKFLSLSGLASSIRSFTNAESALAYFSNNPKNETETIVLLDLQLAGMSGFDFLDAFCTLDESLRKNIRIFMLSSTADTSDFERVIAHPCLEALLPKPLDIEKLKPLLV